MKSLYMRSATDSIKLHFLKTIPSSTPDCDRKTVIDSDDNCENLETSDKEPGQHFTPKVDISAEAYPTITIVRKKFSRIFTTITPKLTYKDRYEKFTETKHTLNFYKGSVIYMEVRITISDLSDSNGNIYGPKECAQICNIFLFVQNIACSKTFGSNLKKVTYIRIDRIS